MPTIITFNGIRIYINYNDHQPPHVHAQYGECEAAFSIQTGEIIAGDFPKHQTKIVTEFILTNADELLNMWDVVCEGGQAWKL